MPKTGFVLLDKVAGETSFKALFPLKRVFSTKRVGHAGTLDLRASGLIIAAIGRSTRLLPFVEAKEKCYQFRLHLGYTTDTLEWDGTVLKQDNQSVSGSGKSITQEDLEQVLQQFLGPIEQVPPKYCAVKINGVRASDLMERGRDVDLKPRKIFIQSLKVLGPADTNDIESSGSCFAAFDMVCECSKGTYIRALGRDIAQALGTFGCVSRIRRLRIGNVLVDQASLGENITLDNLLPVDKVLDFPVVTLEECKLAVIRQGNWIPWKVPIEGVDGEGNIFVANMEREVVSLCKYEAGRIKPKVYLAED